MDKTMEQHRLAPAASQGYQTLTSVVVVATVLLITVGAIVRSTGSGLGCPDWPLCYGEVFPLRDRAAVIEWSHRALAGIVGLLILAEVLWTVRIAPRSRRALVALFLLGVLAVQALLGREAVRRDLPPTVVAIHMLTALTLLAGLVWLAVRARWPSPAVPIRPSRGRGLAFAVFVGMTVVMALGAYQVSAGASLGCSSWPGCAEAPVPLVDGTQAQTLHWLHRLTVAGVFLLVAYQLATIRHLTDLVLLRQASVGIFALYLVQILLGAANVWMELEAGVRVAHLLAGSLLWVAVVGQLALTWTANPESERSPALAAGRGGW